MNITVGCNPFHDILCDYIAVDLEAETYIVTGSCVDDGVMKEKLIFDQWNNTCAYQDHTFTEPCRGATFEECNFAVTWDECAQQAVECAMTFGNGTSIDCVEFYAPYWVCDDYTTNYVCTNSTEEECNYVVSYDCWGEITDCALYFDGETDVDNAFNCTEWRSEWYYEWYDGTWTA
jgi:hypothetical protein